MAEKKLYTEKSIESLDPREFTRLRAGVYVGDTAYSTQLLDEIIANAVDEWAIGNCTEINVKIDNDIVSVEDNGQGFLINSKREDGKTILEASFSVMNTSGKFTEDGVYEGTALGLNGIGSKLCNWLSKKTHIISYRDGKYEELFFKDGLFESRKVGTTSHHSGTFVEWQADPQFFTHAEVDVNKVKNTFKTLVCLCNDLTINLNNNGEKLKYYSKHGLNDLVDEYVKDKELLKNRFIFNFEQGKNKMDMVLTYTSNYSSTIVPYVNTGLTESGPHITQIKTIITREFNKFFKDKKWLKEKDANLSGDDIQEGMYLVFNLTAPNISYDAQTKSRVVKVDMTPFSAAIGASIQEWLANNEKEIKSIFDKAAAAKKAREAAKRARDIARKPKEKGLKAKMALSDKFIDSSCKDPSKRTLLLVEGLSAGGSTLEARNVETDCIYMLRGKILSTLKCDTSKILANQELSDIIKVIGAGFGNDNFDVNKMNFSKIVITSDQDSDGMAIELLLITFFYTYMRPLIEAGRLYRAVTPLYIITQGKNKKYCYTEEELDDWKKNNNSSYELAHCKGLGELSSEVLKEVCFEHQRYKRLTISDAEKTTELLEILEGKKVEPRKQYIYDNAERLGFNFV